MRAYLPVYVILLLPIQGCSALVALSGEDLSRLKTREEVHREFGFPFETGVKDGLAYEDFQSHRKVREDWMGMGIAMMDATTCFMAEFYLFPFEVYEGTRRSIFGETIRFLYDESGRVRHITVDEHGWIHVPPDYEAKETDATTPPKEKEVAPVAIRPF
jgi:hypothetical protein